MALFKEVLLKVYLFKIFVQVAYSLLNNKPVDWSTVTQSTGKVFQRLCMFSVSLCLFVLEIFFFQEVRRNVKYGGSQRTRLTAHVLVGRVYSF